MVAIAPIPRALVPVDSAAADAISGPNYDEFQSDLEIWELIQRKPESILRVTMPHTDSVSENDMLEDGSPEALERGGRNMAALVDSALTREATDVVWVYEILDPRRPGVRQIGIGGLVPTGDIRTEENPDGTVLRNEGIREPKARGRADLVRATSCFIGCVNLAVDDADGGLAAALEAHADAHAPDFKVTDEDGNRHRSWLVTGDDAAALIARTAAEPYAYVADGNHRSAAAVLLGYPHFLAVIFTAERMGIAPYNRLVRAGDPDPGFDGLVQAAGERFECESLDGAERYQPTEKHEIGLYGGAGRWVRLRPRAGTFEEGNPVQEIDADIVQRNLFAALLGIEDVGSPRLTFVGANKGADYLEAQVDAGRYAYALTLPAVRMQDFIRVCQRRQFMPPKSTWFQPKVRSGLVIALL